MLALAALVGADLGVMSLSAFAQRLAVVNDAAEHAGQQGHVGPRIGPDHGGRIFVAVLERHGDVLGILDHMVVGDEVPVRRNEEARALSESRGRLGRLLRHNGWEVVEAENGRAALDRLAERLVRVCSGQHAEPLEPWIEQLYRRVSDRQTMSSVVQELRASLSEVERQIDQFFRNPRESGLLVPVPVQLKSMHGVLGLLGIEQACLAIDRVDLAFGDRVFFLDEDFLDRAAVLGDDRDFHFHRFQDEQLVAGADHRQLDPRRRHRVRPGSPCRWVMLAHTTPR